MKEIPAERIENLRVATLQISIATHDSKYLFEFYSRIHEIVSGLMPARNFFISTYNREKNSLSFPYFVDEVDSPDGATCLPPVSAEGDTLTGQVIKQERMLHLFKEPAEGEDGFGDLEPIGGDSEEWLGVPLRNVSGEITGVIVVQRYDKLTRPYDKVDEDTLNFVSNQIALAIELKQKDEVIRLGEDKYKALIENLNDIIYSFDPKGFIRFISPAVKRYGYTEADIIGKNVSFILHEEDHEKFLKHTLEVLKGSLEPITVRLYDKERRIRWFHTVNSLYRDGDSFLINGALSDITDRVRMEEDLKISRLKLYEANQAKDNFFSILAHDLKSPFTGILGFSEFLVNDINDLSLDEISEFANRINTSARAILDLLNNLLDWSRIQTNRLEVSQVEVAVDEILFNVNSIVIPIINQKGLEYICDIPENVKMMVDRAMIETVFRNLITNAVKFTPRGGSIIVTGELTGNEVTFIVSDSGVGMDNETREKLFKLNELVTTSGTENEKGTGLGLKLCYEFVKRNGGELTVESRKGEGSSFSFSLPLV